MMTATRTVLDVCAGIGGFEVALRERGLNGLAVENAPHPRRTLEANGVPLLFDDLLAVRALLEAYARHGNPIQPRTPAGLVGGPPCPPWSQASRNPRGLDDPRARLMHAFRELALSLLPPFVIGENVPKSADVWRLLAGDLRAVGYEVDVRVVCAADYGDAQARKRALMVARRDGEPVAWPAVTHAPSKAIALLEANGVAHLLKPWTTLADLLPGRTFDGLEAWAHRHPCSTIVGSFEADKCAPPTWRKPGDPPRQKTPGAISLSHEERLAVQGFPAGWVVTGPKTARDLQIGNAIPPTLARVALAAALD